MGNDIVGVNSDGVEEDSPECLPKESDFQQLFFRFRRPLYNFFVNRGFSREESHDLTQETFLEAFRSFHRFRGHARLETWLFAIARNVWRLDLRRRSREKRSAVQEISLDGMTEREHLFLALSEVPAHNALAAGEPLDRFLGKERAKLLRTAVASLPGQMRGCMVLRLVHGLKYEEIAGVLQISIGTVKSQLSEARVRLRARLADLWDESEF